MDTQPTHDADVPYVPHVGETRQYWRDIILGVNDGLVSMVLLVAGVVGAGLSREDVFVTGVAGALAGAVSMGLGEYLATKSQDEVLTSEMELERQHITHHRQMELDQLREMFTDMGLGGDDIDSVVAAFDRSDEALLNAMKALEFGAPESERRSPYRAMAFSSLLFLAGSMPSVVPFMLVESATTGLWWATVLAGLGLFSVGVAKTRVTKTNPLTSGLENLTIAGVGGVLAYYVGVALGSGPV
ncbi:MAG TPA: VIT1/CCC1 transporter family protein [Acidimicrobiia bacterium]|nr:VIT1/CCC1 transporter family protein [Acidimicrobiia bacterium]